MGCYSPLQAIFLIQGSSPRRDSSSVSFGRCRLLNRRWGSVSGFPGGSAGEASACNVGGKILRRREWQPTPVPLPGKYHGWRSWVRYSPWGRKELDTTERLHFPFRDRGTSQAEIFFSPKSAMLWFYLHLWYISQCTCLKNNSRPC